MVCKLTSLFFAIFLSARLMLALKDISRLDPCRGISEYNDTCVYPKMCMCPMMNTGGYMRLTLWHYDNSTGRCRKIVGSNANGFCNMFEKNEDCRKSCKKPLKKWHLKPKAWNDSSGRSNAPTFNSEHNLHKANYTNQQSSIFLPTWIIFYSNLTKGWIWQWGIALKAAMHL